MKHPNIPIQTYRAWIAARAVWNAHDRDIDNDEYPDEWIQQLFENVMLDPDGDSHIVGLLADLRALCDHLQAMGAIRIDFDGLVERSKEMHENSPKE